MLGADAALRPACAASNQATSSSRARSGSGRPGRGPCFGYSGEKGGDLNMGRAEGQCRHGAHLFAGVRHFKHAISFSRRVRARGLRIPFTLPQRREAERCHQPSSGGRPAVTPSEITRASRRRRRARARRLPPCRRTGRSQRPEEGRKAGEAERQRHGHQVDQHGHRDARGRSPQAIPSDCAASPPRPRARNALSVTRIDEPDIAAAAISGVTSPRSRSAPRSRCRPPQATGSAASGAAPGAQW